MARDFCYLVGIIDACERQLLATRLSNSMVVRFCQDALEVALERFGRPGAFNCDQGAQYTSSAFASVLEVHNIRTSMDGKGAGRDNVFFQRFWWSLKCEHVNLHAYGDLRVAKERISLKFGAKYSSPH